MSKLFKRVCCLSLAVAMTATLFVGCGEKEKENTSSETKATVSEKTDTSASAKTAEEEKGFKIDPSKKCTIRFYTSAALNKTEMDENLPEFNKKYPNITVETVLLPGADYLAKLKTSIVAGEQIDVIEVSTANLERAQAGSMYMPLNDLADKVGMDVQKEYGDYVKQLTVDDKLYGIPKYLAPGGIWYNKKHFDEAGIPYPTPDWTWDEFFEIAKKLTKKDASGKVTRYGFYDWSFMSGGVAATINNLALFGGWEMFNDDGTLNSIDDPRYKKAVESYYNAAMVDKSIPDIATVTAEKLHYMYDMYKGRWSMLISARNTALFFDIHRQNGQLTTEDDDAGIYGLAYMPKWDKNSPSKQSIDSVGGDAICKNTKNPDEAFAFIYWHTTDCLLGSSKIAHRVPASRTVDTKTLMDNWTYYKNKDGNIVKGKDRADLYKILLDPEIKPIFPVNSYKYPYSSKVNDELNKEMSLLFAGEKDMAKALADAKAAMQKAYEAEKK